MLFSSWEVTHFGNSNPVLIRRLLSDNAGISAPFGHEQGERFIGGILEGRATFQNGSVPLGIDPELNDDAASFTLLCAQSGLTFPRLSRGIERGCFRTTWTASLWR